MMPENCGGMDKTAIIDKVAASKYFYLFFTFQMNYN